MASAVAPGQLRMAPSRIDDQESCRNVADRFGIVWQRAVEQHEIAGAVWLNICLNASNGWGWTSAWRLDR